MEYSFINDPVLRGKLEKASKLNISNIETINENKFSGLSAKMALSDWSKVSG